MQKKLEEGMSLQGGSGGGSIRWWRGSWVVLIFQTCTLPESEVPGSVESKPLGLG